MGTSIRDFFGAPNDPAPSIPRPLSTADFLKAPPLDQAVRLGQEETPANAGRVLKLQRTTGLPTDVIARNVDEVDAESQRRALDVEAFRREHPTIAKWMAEHPLHAAVAMPDLSAMGKIEAAATALKLGYRGGRLQSEVAEQDYATLTGRRAQDPMSVSMLDQRRKASQAEPTNRSFGQDVLFQTGKLVGQMVPGTPDAVEGGLKGAIVGAGLSGIAAAAGVAGAAITIPALAGAGVAYGLFNYTNRQEAGSAYQGLSEIRGTNGEEIPEPVKRNAAYAVGALNGAIEVALDASVLAKPFTSAARKFFGNVQQDALVRPTMRAALATFGKHYAAALIAEPTQEVAQELTNVVAEEIAKLASHGSFATVMNDPDQRVLVVQRLADIAEQTAKGTLLLAGIGPSLNLGTDVVKARQATARQNQFLALGEALQKASQPAQDAGAHTEIAARAMGESSVYVDVDKFSEYFQSQGHDPRDVARQIWGSTEAYDQAAQAAHALEIPVRLYAEKIAPTEANAFFARELRLVPDGMNAREGEAFLGNVEQEQATRAGEAATATIAANERQSLVDEIAGHVEATGMLRAQDAATSAEPMADFVRVMAQRVGQDPAAFLAEHGPRIIGPTSAPTTEGVAAPAASAQTEGSFFLQAPEERIAAPVFKGASGRLYAPRHENHGHAGAIAKAKTAGDVPAADSFGANQGFVTTTGRFLGRAEALDLAERVGQVTPSVAAEVRHFWEGFPNPETRGLGSENIDEFADVPAGMELFQSSLNQRATEGPRGSIRFGGKDGTVIQLNANANLSTFLHESGHFYLDVLGTLATAENAAPDITKDYATILTALGVENRSQIGRDQHEQFARMAEAYLMRGEAPSIALRRAFARFKTWLMALYRTMKGLDVELSPEVVEVFDRLFATESEIEAAQKDAAIAPIFADAPSAGMTDEQFAKYRQQIEDAHTAASDRVRTRVFKQYLRERDQWWKDARGEMKADVAAEVNQRPEYVALSVLRRGTLPDGTQTNTPKLSKADLVALRGRAFLSRMTGLYQVDGGLPLEQAAEQFGYASGDELVQALVDATPRTKLIESLTDERMRAKYGDMLSDGSIADEADKAVMVNDDQAEVVRAEMRALRRLIERETKDSERAKAKASATEANAETRAAAREGRQILSAGIPDPKFLRDLAEQRIAGLKVRDLKPFVYWVAARKASKAAVALAARQDYVGALNAKQTELLNQELYRAAVKAGEESDTIHEYVRGLQRTKKQQSLGKAGADYLEQINAMLERFDFATLSNVASERRHSLAQFILRQEELGLPVDIPDALQDSAFRTPWREMTLEQLRGVYDTLKHIDHLASLKNRLLKSLSNRELGEARDLVASTVTANAKRTFARTPETNLPQDRASRAVRGFFAAHRKLASYIREMDGFQDGGPIWDTVMRPLNDASNARSDFNAKATEWLATIFETHYTKAETAELYRRTFVNAKMGSISKMGRLMMALNFGTEDNQRKLVAGLSLTYQREIHETDVGGVLNTLDERDWRFVQDVWAFINSYWPEMKAMAERLDGISAEKIDGIEVQTKFGPVLGAYFPLVYDRTQSTLKHHDAVSVSADEVRHGSTVKASTKAGSRHGRVEGVQSPLRLDFGVIREHLTDVANDLTHTETLIDVGRILTGDQVKEAIRDHYGDTVYREILGTVDAIAAGHVPPQNTFEAAVGYLRAGTTVAGLGWNLVTSALQPIGLTNSMVRVGPTWIAKGLGEWLGDAVHMENTATWITAKSQMMQYRVTTQLRETAELMNVIGFDQGILDALADRGIDKATAGTIDLNDLKQSYFWFVSRMQLVADIPTWLGAYRKALETSQVDDATAVAMADQAVLDSQSGGDIKDLADVQRGGPVMKLFTTFYSFMNLAWNMHVEAVAATDFKRPASIGRLAVDLLMLSVVPVAIGYFIKRALRGEDDKDTPETLAALAREEGSFLTGMLVGLREVSGVIQGFKGYDGLAGARFFSSFGKAINQVSQGESDRALWSSLNATAGVLFHYPAGQVQRSVDGFMALKQGKTRNPSVLLFGPSR